MSPPPANPSPIGASAVRSSPIQTTDDATTAVGARRFTMPLDPLLTLAAVGLAIASVVTLGPATQNVIAGQPDYYVHRQTIYLVVGGLLMLVVARVDYGRLRQLKIGIYVLLMLSILAVL